MAKRRYPNERLDTSSHGQLGGYLISDHEFGELQRLRALERRVYRVEELPREVAKAIERSEMDPYHSHLDALLDEK